MTLQIKRHLGEEIVIKGFNLIKPIKLKITNVFEENITLEVDHDPTLAVAGEVYFEEPNTVLYEKFIDIKANKERIRTPIEQIVFQKHGRELKVLMKELSSLNKTILEASKILGIQLSNVRTYCKKYNIAFKKSLPGWNSASDYRKNEIRRKS